MSTAAKITVDLETRTAAWSKGLEGASKEVKTWAKDVSGQFKALSFGDGFDAKGVAKFGDALADVSKQATEFATQIRTGTSYAEALNGVVDQIPIVGKFRQAGESIRELVTGEKAAKV